MPANTALTHKIAIALGSNLGDRLASLRAAVQGLADYMEITAISPVYETPPLYVTDQPSFLNAAVTGTTKLEPLPLLRAVKDLENDLGRKPSFHYGPREIDIDILFYDDDMVNVPELILPHPRLAEREFVLRPLADIAPDWRHPQTGVKIATILAQLPDPSARKLKENL